jgi:hypothetical protein
MAGKSADPGRSRRSGLVMRTTRKRSYTFRPALLPGILLVLLFATDPVGAQVDETEIPHDRILSLPGPNRFAVTVGEQFSVPVILEQTAPQEVSMTLPPLPPGIAVDEVPILLSGPEEVVEARIMVEARRAGRFVIEPIRIQTATGAWYVPRLLVEVAPSRDAAVPFGVRWRLLQEPVYQGQSTPVVLEITGIDSFTYPDSISIRSPQTGFFEETSGIGSVSSRIVAGVELFEIPVAVFLFTPTSAGDVVLPAAEVTAQGMSITSNALTVSILTLPESVRTGGAVGEFDFRASVDRNTVVPGETIELEMVLEGTGNIQVLDFPDVVATGLREVDQDEAETVGPDTETLLGYRGARTRRIRFEPDSDSRAGSIRVERFSFLDPRDDFVTTLDPHTWQIEILVDASEIEPERTMPDLALLTVTELMSLRWYRILDQRRSLLLFMIAPVLFGLGRLLSVRKKPRIPRAGAVSLVAALILFVSWSIVPSLDLERLFRAEELIEEGNHAVAGVLYDLELQEHDNHAGLHYNRGVLAVRTGNTLAAVYHLRRAARLVPENAYVRSALVQALDYLETPDQIDLPVAVRPDFFFIAFLLLWTGFWLLLLLKPTLPRTITLISILMVGVLFSAGFIWAYRVENRPEGMVQRDVTVRRIPDLTAEPWLELLPATVVHIELSYDEFYLVRTSSGVTGWVSRRDVRGLGGSDES